MPTATTSSGNIGVLCIDAGSLAYVAKVIVFYMCSSNTPVEKYITYAQLAKQHQAIQFQTVNMQNKYARCLWREPGVTCTSLQGGSVTIAIVIATGHA